MKYIIATVSLIAVISGSAHALKEDREKLLTDVVGLNAVSVDYRIDDNGVATLYGQVDSLHEAALALNHVENIEGVDRVINLVTVK